MNGRERPLLDHIRARAMFLWDGWVHHENRWELAPLAALRRAWLERDGDDGPWLANHCGQAVAETGQVRGGRAPADAARRADAPDNPNYAARLNNLAGLLRATNRLAEAEPLYRRALAIDERRLGQDHPNVATGLNNLASLLQATNRLAEAEPLYPPGTGDRRGKLRPGPSQGRHRPQQPGGVAPGHEPARPRRSRSMRRALAIDEAKLAARTIPKSPPASTTWRSCCRPRTGWPRPNRFRRALAIDEASFGPDHPDVATRPQQPGAVAAGHEPAGRGGAAHRRALAITRRSFGPDHPNVAIRPQQPGELLQATNRLAEAEPLMAAAR